MDRKRIFKPEMIKKQIGDPMSYQIWSRIYDKIWCTAWDQVRKQYDPVWVQVWVPVSDQVSNRVHNERSDSTRSHMVGNHMYYE